ncbi:hypothetical protein M413DRAFT_30435 [Hebeloma cylindrosporum]|uniref:Uncharacterized protein n=1 Tax=Hebeloma cylindrosporum TaxID=76867 RepID=A0A0C2YAH5_HEBCY|nr:hypothetical protein M413DRAFT_30435 [Hebeloma cylindrosporum h7]
MPSRVSSIHDLESGEEFERIKQNFRSTVIAPDVTADFPETQAAFEELQFELQEFLVQHISKVSALQGRIASNVRATDSSGEARVSQGTVTPISVSRRPSGAESRNSHVVLEGANDEKGGAPLPRRAVLQVAKNPLEIHMAALQTFLAAHLENVRALQSSVPPVVDGRRATGKSDQVHKGTRAGGGQEDEMYMYATLAQQFHMRVVISTFTAVLIVMLLALVDGIIGPRRRIAFSVAMLFSFMALSIHFANIFLAGRGAMLTTTTISGGTNPDIDSLRFYLAICGNLHLASTVLLLVSIAVMIFLIFSSIAFPLVLLFLSGIAALIVFVSAYWEVPVTLGNVVFLAANVGRLKSSLESLRRSARAARRGASRAV